MTDLLRLYDVLRLPRGAQLVSDRGEVTLLTIARDGPNKLTLERVPLGTAVSVDQLWRELEQRGLLHMEPTNAAPLEGGVGTAARMTLHAHMRSTCRSSRQWPASASALEALRRPYRDPF